MGGGIGYSGDSAVQDCYAITTFYSSDASGVGGFVGQASNSTMRNCYAHASVTGYNTISNFVSQSYTSSYIHCYGYPAKQQSSFVGWDFLGESANGDNEIWRMCMDGVDYPRLSWESARSGDFACGDGVGMPDLALLAENWLTSTAIEPGTFNYACDADGDEQIDLKDYDVLSKNYEPSFDVSTNVLTFSVYHGNPNPENQVVTVVNSNTMLLDWNIDTGGLPDWLNITPTSGSLQTAESEDVFVSVDVSGLATGQYSYTFNVVDSGLSGLMQTVQVNLTILGPEIYLSPTNLDFQRYEGETPSTRSEAFFIENKTDGVLNWGIDPNILPDWLSVSSLGGDLKKHEDDYITVTVDAAGLSGGQYSHNLEIIDSNASNSPQSIAVTFTVIGPKLELSPNSISAQGYEASSAVISKYITIYNRGGGTLQWTIPNSDIPDWLTFETVSGSLPYTGSLSYQTIKLSLSADALEAGQYMYDFDVVDPNATDSPQAVTIDLEVLGPEMKLSNTGVDFTGYFLGSNPSSQSISVSNKGGGLLEWAIDDTNIADWLTINPIVGMLEHDQTENIGFSVDMTGLDVGQYTCTLPINAPDTTASSQTITISLDLLGPVLDTSKSSLSFSADESGTNPDGQTLTIINDGGGILNWNINVTDKPDWLIFSSVNGSLEHNQSENITLSVDISGMAFGVYNYSLEIVDQNASNSPFTVPISLTIRGFNILVPNDYSTIQEAINGAAEGGTITVLPGTYYENLQFNGRNIILSSSDSDDSSVVESTIIDASFDGRPITFHGSETSDCVIRGLTITNGYVTSYYSSDYDYYNGGGIYGNGTHAAIEKCIIRNNTAYYGGGLYACYGEILDCTINNNVVYRNGAGLYACGGSIINCFIQSNKAGISGLICYGGGLYGCDGTIKNCTISNNTVDAYGGGICHCDASIISCIISNNTAGHHGGGLYSCDGAITNCTISNNTSDDYGGGIDSCDGQISNCILWENKAGVSYDQLLSSSRVSYSCIQNWTGGGEGNISSDPQFADVSSADPANWDLHLTAGSGCIDAGTNSPIGGLPETDLDGNPRIVDGDGNGSAVVDMGAYEHQP